MEWMLLPLKRYADFSGRSRRKEFWMFYLLMMMVLFGGFMLASLVSIISDTLSALVSGAMFLALLGMFIPMLAVQVRRFHDQDKPGWFVVLGMFIPFFAIVFMCMEGTKGPNKYGEDPKGTADLDTFR
ncbi:MAG: DUF805 domain-containing protein [Sphingopyxis sp.]